MDRNGSEHEKATFLTTDAGAARALITVLIVVEVCLYREGLTRTLAQWPSLSVVGSIASVEEGSALMRELQPQVVLLDLAAERAAALVRRIGELAPGARIVALGVRDEEQDILRCAEAGMAGYVPRNGSISDLVVAIESAANGELRCSPRIAASLFQRVAALTDARQMASTAILTRREQEIVRLIGQGLSNKQIGHRLQIEVSTVKNHVHSVLTKLHAPRRALAAARVWPPAVPYGR